MLHVTINEQGRCLYVRDDILDKMFFFHMFSYNALVFGTLSYKSIFLLADYTAHGP